MTKKKHPKKSRPEIMWAVVRIGPRTEWVNAFTISHQRKDSVRLYLREWSDEHRPKIEKQRNKTWRVTKVRVEEIGNG